MKSEKIVNQGQDVNAKKTDGKRKSRLHIDEDDNGWRILISISPARWAMLGAGISGLFALMWELGRMVRQWLQ